MVYPRRAPRGPERAMARPEPRKSPVPNGPGQRNHLDMSLMETLLDQTDLAEMIGGGVIVGELFFGVLEGVFSRI